MKSNTFNKFCDFLEYIEKDVIKFKFSYLNNCRELCPDECVEENKRNRLNGKIDEMKSYEEFLYIKKWQEILLDALDNKDDTNFLLYRFKIFLEILHRKDGPFKNHKILNKDFYNFEKELSYINEIQKRLKNSYETNGYPEINLTVILNNKKAMKIIERYVKLAIDSIDKYYSGVDVTKLEKAYYSKNFDNFIQLFNIDKNSNSYYWLMNKFYQAVRRFYYDLLTLNKEEISIDALDNLPRAIVDLPFDSVKSSDAYINEDFFIKCLRKYKSDDDFIASIITKLEDSKLTKKDFKYVKEFNYMESLLKHALENKEKGINILLWGKPGTGKTELAKVLIKQVNAIGYNANEANNKTNSSLRQSGLNRKDYNFILLKDLLKNKNNSVIVYDEAEDFFTKGIDSDSILIKSDVNNLLEENEVPVIWTTNKLYLEKSYLRRFTYICEVNDMSKNNYKKLYTNILKQYNLTLKNKELFEICYENKITAGILNKVFSNYIKTVDKDENNILIELQNIYKVQANEELKIKKYSGRPKKFDTKLLNTSDNLQEFAEKIKKLGRTDFSLLLYGVSGSGKSYYAEYLAETLEMPLIKKKASDLESMWVGETEKNIAKAFEEAKNEKAILVIDEGDHFISERSNHHQSWETSRTEEMLQQIEIHPYPVIFTTNLIENIDKAAMRRFTYKTKFNYLTKEQVKIAWKDYFPKAKLPNELYLSRICPGDFATVYKKAEFEDYLTDSDKLYKKLEEEQDIKKEFEYSSIKL